MTDVKKMTVRETKARTKHSDWMMLAGITLRGYGFPELGDELASLAERIRSGEFDYDPARVID